MADYDMIDGYLAALRTTVQWRRDVDDLVAELEDHLYSAAERYEAGGADPHLAQRRTLDRFGDPDLVANAFASTAKGGIAVPTTFTRSAGLVALLSSACWLIALLAGMAAIVLPDSRPSTAGPDQFVLNGETAAFVFGFAAAMTAGVLMVVAMVGLSRRHGSLGASGVVAISITAIGVVASFAWWAFAIWMSLIGLGTLLFAVIALRRDVAPRGWTAIWGGGLALGVVVWSVLRWLQVGTPDEWGDYPIANSIGVIVGVALMAIGLAGIGRWLRGKEPSDIAPIEPLAAA